jgi:hypothetical protein
MGTGHIDGRVRRKREGARRGVRTLLCAALLAPICAAVGSSAAGAAGAGSFGIASFAMQTTRTIEVPRGPGVPGPGFAEEPYAFTQAAGHPEALTSSVAFDNEEVGEAHAVAPTRDPKDLVIDLPPGLVANPQATPRCALERGPGSGECPPATQVGIFAIRTGGNKVLFGPIVNVAPEAGQAAELALEAKGVSLPITGRLVRTVQGYGLAVVMGGLPAVGVVSVQTTLWGVPALEGHDGERGLFCEGEVDREWSCEGGGEKSGQSPAPFLTTGSDCAAGPLIASAQADSWEEPGRWVEAQASLPTTLSGPPQGMSGCNLLRFAASLEVKPETLLADEPLGLGVDVEAAQSEAVSAAGTPPLREAVVTLPHGVSISPAVANGVTSCPAAGPQGIDMPAGLSASGAPLRPDEVGEGEQAGPDGLARLAPGHCPKASAIGVAEARTPLVPGPLKGRIYLAQPGCGGVGRPCGERDALDGTLYRVYVELGGAGASIDVKLAGYVSANPVTGRLTLRLGESPQLPLSQLTIKLNGGPRALLDSPPGCGRATSSADVAPWSAPGTTPEGLLTPGTPDATTSSFYEVGGCATPPGLAPGFIAGTLNPRAGSYSPFTLTVTRNDREQYLAGIQAQLPEGLLGKLASVPLCGEPAAREGDCPASSRIGTSLVATGAGSRPYELGGEVYLTGPYEGAPFGVSIVTRALVGPFDLGTIVVRARIDVDLHTAALTIASDPLPQILLGVPLRLRRVTLDLDRPGFMFNPTGCKAKRVMGTIAGALGARADVVGPFAVARCGSLPFSPKLTALTRANGEFDGHGASLHVVVTSAAGQANIRSLKVDLPQKLPARAQTVQHACRRGVFEHNPATCPRASLIGSASVATPVLGAPMRGPIFLVTHGGGGFPDMVVVLQAQGVRIDLTGSLYVDEKNVTSTSFRAMPDVPIRRFDLILPEGPQSVLVAGASLCAKRLHISTAMTGQNGARIKRTVPVAVMGCRRKRGHKRHTAQSSGVPHRS